MRAVSLLFSLHSRVLPLGCHTWEGDFYGAIIAMGRSVTVLCPSPSPSTSYMLISDFEMTQSFVACERRVFELCYIGLVVLDVARTDYCI